MRRTRSLSPRRKSDIVVGKLSSTGLSLGFSVERVVFTHPDVPDLNYTVTDLLETTIPQARLERVLNIMLRDLHSTQRKIYNLTGELETRHAEHNANEIHRENSLPEINSLCETLHLSDIMREAYQRNIDAFDRAQQEEKQRCIVLSAEIERLCGMEKILTSGIKRLSVKFDHSQPPAVHSDRLVCSCGIYWMIDTPAKNAGCPYLRMAAFFYEAEQWRVFPVRSYIIENRVYEKHEIPALIAHRNNINKIQLAAIGVLCGNLNWDYELMTGASIKHMHALLNAAIKWPLEAYKLSRMRWTNFRFALELLPKCPERFPPRFEDKLPSFSKSPVVLSERQFQALERFVNQFEAN
jgi:hypothetical protein